MQVCNQILCPPLEKIVALPVKIVYPVMPVMNHLSDAESPASFAFLSKHNNLCSNAVYFISALPHCHSSSLTFIFMEKKSSLGGDIKQQFCLS